MRQYLSSKSSQYWIYIALVAIFLFVQTASAQSGGDVKLTVNAGFDGYCKQNRWLPVKVSVENSGPDVEAQIELSYSSAYGQKNAQTAAISLPTTSRKEFFLYLYPPQYTNTLKMSVLAGKQILASTTIKLNCLVTEDLLIGLLSDNPSAYGVLNEVSTLVDSAGVAQIKLADLPDQAQGWAALDGLVISGVDTQQLDPAQRQALELWIADGGKLFVVGGTNWQGAAAGLGDLLPIAIERTQNVPTLEALREFLRENEPLEGEAILAVGSLRPGATVLVEQDNLPVLVQKTVGFGQVYYFAADPGLQPLSRWDGMRAVYEFALARKSFNVWNTSWVSEPANRALSALPELGIPSFFVFCGWISLYLLVIGPINYFFLRRIKRMDLAWISIPALVIVFTITAYAAGSLYRGAEPTLNRMGVIYSWEGIDQAQVRALAGLYSPTRTKYNLETDAPFMVYAFDNTDDQNWDALQTGAGSVFSDISVEIGGMKTFALDGKAPAIAMSHDLTYEMVGNKLVLKGSITNNSPYTIENAELVFPNTDRKENLGSFSSGETIKIQAHAFIYDTIPMTPLYNQYSGYGYVPNEKAYRRELLEQSIATNSLWRNDWCIYVRGWIENPSVPVRVGGRNFDKLDTNLAIVMLNPVFAALPAGEIYIPNTLMLREASADVTQYGYIPTEGYQLRFWPGLPIRFNKVESLTLHQDIVINASGTKLVIFVWNYSTRNWDEINVSLQNEIEIPDPEQHVGPGGEIRAKLESSSQDWVSINVFDFEMVVSQ